jgi:hypothetical protein
MSSSTTKTADDADIWTAPSTRLPLLARMQRDLREQGSLRPTTVVVMYAAYGVHAATTVVALRNRWLPLALPRRAAQLVGCSAA